MVHLKAMKFLTFVFAGLVLVSVSAFGASIEIQGSNYELRHQRLIAIELAQKCGTFEHVGVMGASEESIRVDQGIVDKRFTTVLILSNGAHSRTAVVVSFYGDHYDHQAKDWGAYSVESVDCAAQPMFR